MYADTTDTGIPPEPQDQTKPEPNTHRKAGDDGPQRLGSARKYRTKPKLNPNTELNLADQAAAPMTGHERTERGLEESGGGRILHPPSVQFKLYQGEVLPYNPGTRDWVE